MDQLLVSYRALGVLLALAGEMGLALGMLLSSTYHEFISWKRISRLEVEFQRLKERYV